MWHFLETGIIYSESVYTELKDDVSGVHTAIVLEELIFCRVIWENLTRWVICPNPIAGMALGWWNLRWTEWPIFHLMTQPGDARMGTYSIYLTCVKTTKQGDHPSVTTPYENQQYANHVPQIQIHPNNDFRVPNPDDKRSSFSDSCSVILLLGFLMKLLTWLWCVALSCAPIGSNLAKMLYTQQWELIAKHLIPPVLIFDPSTNLIKLQ